MTSFFTSNKLLFAAMVMGGLIFVGIRCAKPDTKPPLMLSEACNTNTLFPQNVQSLCPIPQDTLKTWFASNDITPNGMVKPADGLQFPSQVDCDFHKWSEQMFLWITSPVGDGYVLNSPAFFTLLDGDSISIKGNLGGKNRSKRAILRENAPHKPLLAKLRSSKTQTEQGQAGGSGVLMEQTGSLVYYMTMVNDVYAYFKMAADAGAISGVRFPTTKLELDSILAYTKKIGKTLAHPNALALELKTSWVEVTEKTCQPQGFITIDAEVPVYDKSNPKLWKLDPKLSKKVKLAMVGMHIAGSANAHPELIWATFEHRTNTPNATYAYQNTAGKVDTFKADNKQGKWLFCNPNNTPTNTEYMKLDSNHNIAGYNSVIQATDVSRTMPWGGDPASDGNPQKKLQSSVSNANVISANTSIQNGLKEGDIRKNYIFIGSIWTRGGRAPVTETADTTNYNLVGSTMLSNSTMETYHMNLSCFTCHGDSKNKGQKATVAVSHIFHTLKTNPVTLNSSKK